VQLGRPSFLVIGLGILDLEFMQFLTTPRDRSADGSFGIGRLQLLGDERPYQFSSFADYMNSHVLQPILKVQIMSNVGSAWIVDLNCVEIARITGCAQPLILSYKLNHT
jgi:hypothetical protein